VGMAKSVNTIAVLIANIDSVLSASKPKAIVKLNIIQVIHINAPQ
jgi:hypothetical protein